MHHLGNRAVLSRHANHWVWHPASARTPASWIGARLALYMVRARWGHETTRRAARALSQAVGRAPRLPRGT
jgi:hypothetical protein